MTIQDDISKIVLAYLDTDPLGECHDEIVRVLAWLVTQKEDNEMVAESKDEQIQRQFDILLLALKELKPNDRSASDRYWAITITEVEKARAVFSMYAHVEES